MPTAQNVKLDKPSTDSWYEKPNSKNVSAKRNHLQWEIIYLEGEWTERSAALRSYMHMGKELQIKERMGIAKTQNCFCQA